MHAMKHSIIVRMSVATCPEHNAVVLCDVVKRVVLDDICCIDVSSIPAFSIVLVVFKRQLFKWLVVSEYNALLSSVLCKLLPQPCTLYLILVP